MVLDQLDEVRFNLRDLVSEEEFEKYGSQIVRQRFLEFFITDNLDESREELKQRVVEIFAYLFEFPNKLSCVLSVDKKTFPFGEGFDFTLE